MREWTRWIADWRPLTLYQRFESVVALCLTALVGLIAVVALVRLAQAVVMGLLLDVLDPLDRGVFQAVFAEVLTLLIALEFNHTLQFAVTRRQSIIQTKVVLLIAMLAIARKFIILDLDTTQAADMLGLAAIMLSLGIAYWLMRDREEKDKIGAA